jgi:hypothetical protein
VDAILFSVLLVAGLIIYFLTPFIKHSRSAILWFLLSIGHIMFTSIAFNLVSSHWIIFVGTGIVLMCLIGIFQVKGWMTSAFVCWIGILIWHITGAIGSPLGRFLLIFGAIWAIIWRRRFFENS